MRTILNLTPKDTLHCIRKFVLIRKSHENIKVHFLAKKNKKEKISFISQVGCLYFFFVQMKLNILKIIKTFF